MDSDSFNLNEDIDTYLALLGLVILLAYGVTYVLFPPCMPDQQGKPSFLTWIAGTGCLPYFRRFKDKEKQMGAGDFPEASGTDSFNIDLFVSMLEKRWSPDSTEKLFRALLRWAMPWLVFTHILQGVPRMLNLLDPLIVSSIIAYMNSPEDTSPMIMYKLAALKTLMGLTEAVTKQSCQTVLAIRGVNPIWAGLNLMVLRTMHNLSLDSIFIKGVQASWAQQICNECKMMGPFLMDQTPLKTCLVEIFVGIYTIFQLKRLCGLSVALCGVLFAVALYFLSTFAARKQIETGGAVFGANVSRQSTLNLMLEKCREFRMYNWTSRLGSSLDSCQEAIWRETLRGKFWAVVTGMLITVMNPSIVIVYYFVTVFVNGQRVNFEKGMLAFSYMVNIAMSLFTLSGCYGSYLDSYYRAERIESFLRLPQVLRKGFGTGRLELEDATFAFQGDVINEKGDKHIISMFNSLSFKAPEGELILVTGSLSSGKSTFLTSLLGEIPLMEGEAILPEGPVAYQPQLPYLLDGSIRENILFGIPDSECNEEYLKRCLVASQLQVEMDDPRSTLHAKREHTRVGKRGSQLSGGQRARVSVARTVYAVLRGARLAVMDDPLASLDNEVVNATWEAAILGEMRGVTRVVATNTQLLERLAPAADRLVVVMPGRIEFDGTVAEAAQKPELLTAALGGDFQLGRQRAPSAEPEKPAAKEAEVAAPAVEAPEEVAEEQEIEDIGDPMMSLANFVRECPHLNEFVAGTGASEALQLSPPDWRKLWTRLKAIESSCRAGPAARPAAQAPVYWIIWTMFLRTRGLLLITMLLGIFKDAASPMQFRTIQQWEAHNTNWGDIAWCTLLACQVTMFSAIDVGLGNLDGMASLISASLWRRDLDNHAMKLGMPYFWGEASGAEVAFRRITLFEFDQLLPLVRMPMTVAQVFFTVLTLIYYNAEAMATRGLLVSVLCAAAGFRLSTQIAEWKNVSLWNARIEVNTQLDLEVIDQFDSLVVMRSLCRCSYFEQKMRPGFMKEVYWNWMRCSGELIISLISVCISAMFYISGAAGCVKLKEAGGQAWVGMLYWNVTCAFFWNVERAFQEFMPFQNGMRGYRELETFLHTPHVEPTDGEEHPVGWPSKGHLLFENITFHYAPSLPPAVQDVNFEVRAGEKLGIVGRTGSGKSTIASLLLRLGPLKGVAPRSSGRVLLDDVDIATLKIADIRRIVAVVPQEPTVFPWTLKQNIGEEFSDAEVLTSLEWCGLDSRVLTGHSDDMRTALDHGIAPGVTVGQQQLLMAARALVRRPKVLILDECTAAIDRENADRLLDVIKTHSRDTTVLAIAHRLRFVLNSDRILVLGHRGEVLAFDTPEEVMKDETGYFATNLKLEQMEAVAG